MKFGLSKRVLALCLFLMVGAFSSSQAFGQGQADEFPLILWIRGDLYRVDSVGAAPTPITHNGTISGPEISPDGSVIVYKAASEVGLDALNRIQTSGKIADFDLPGDIMLLTLAAGVSTPLAGQPANASLLAEGVADNALIRSTPVWSPDGTRIAWTEYAYPGGKPSIVVYDRTNGGGMTTIAADIPAPLVQGAAPPLRWGTGVIAVSGSADATSEQDFLIYAEDGTLLSSPRIAAIENDPALDFVWVESAGGAQLGILYQSSRWILIDPQTGVARAADELPRLVTAQPDSQALRFGVQQDGSSFWEIVGGNSAAPGAPSQVTLSPSGQAIAFTGFPSSGAVTIWQDGNTTAVPNTGSNLDELQVGALLWGFTSWRIG